MLDSKKCQAVEECPAPDSWQGRVLQPFHAVAAQVKEIFSGGLLVTTLLLQFIWFTNALAYYGLVLLTTSVSLLPLSLHPNHCTTELRVKHLCATPMCNTQPGCRPLISQCDSKVSVSPCIPIKLPWPVQVICRE